jgi:N-acetylglucosaminyldiphosphoundecaprenol N-acetyl-beta-D-mannosaminyltransferase
MKNITKKMLFQVGYSITDYEEATRIIIKNALNRNSFGVSALAVHGLIEAYKDPQLRAKVNTIDMVVPDGQPVRWALNAIHHSKLKDRVYGPELTRWVLNECDNHALKVYLYGSTDATLRSLRAFIERTFPKINICGVHIDRFREATPEEDFIDIQKINHSGAHVVLVGRGCPRQEKWVANHIGKINSVMMAVGAAFDFHAGSKKTAPKWMQDNGLEWLFRLIQEPQRLWKRYLFTNTYFIYLFFKQILLHGTARLSREKS